MSLLWCVRWLFVSLYYDLATRLVRLFVGWMVGGPTSRKAGPMLTSRVWGTGFWTSSCTAAARDGTLLRLLWAWESSSCNVLYAQSASVRLLCSPWPNDLCASLSTVVESLLPLDGAGALVARRVGASVDGLDRCCGEASFLGETNKILGLCHHEHQRLLQHWY